MDTRSFFQYPGGVVEEADQSSLFLAECSDEEWSILLSYMAPRAFAQGETLVQHGAADDTLYIVQEGKLEVQLPQTKDSFRVIALLDAGAVFGEQAFLDGMPRSATVIGTTNGHMLCLTQVSFKQLAAEHPRLAIKLLFELGRVLSRRYREIIKQQN